jgi:hypothetical protein
MNSTKHPTVKGDLVTVLDESGKPLTKAAIREDVGAATLTLKSIREPDRLFTYFFTRQRRIVSVKTERGVKRGRLETRWRGRTRAWVIHAASS